MSNNIQTHTIGRLTPCLQKKIDKTYLVEVRFSDTSTQNVEDKLWCVMPNDLEHGKQGRPRKGMKNDAKFPNQFFFLYLSYQDSNSNLNDVVNAFLLHKIIEFTVF